mmetsp:Transcript_16043/g.30299  ORF Transcript_16043/g.30299 Transcript_16043/m.30299 type:complete len:732 (-) Transcript_16043:4595-6790(-)
MGQGAGREAEGDGDAHVKVHANTRREHAAQVTLRHEPLGRGRNLDVRAHLTVDPDHGVGGGEAREGGAVKGNVVAPNANTNSTNRRGTGREGTGTCDARATVHDGTVGAEEVRRQAVELDANRDGHVRGSRPASFVDDAASHAAGLVVDDANISAEEVVHAREGDLRGGKVRVVEVLAVEQALGDAGHAAADGNGELDKLAVEGNDVGEDGHHADGVLRGALELHGGPVEVRAGEGTAAGLTDKQELVLRVAPVGLVHHGEGRVDADALHVGGLDDGNVRGGLDIGARHGDRDGLHRRRGLGAAPVVGSQLDDVVAAGNRGEGREHGLGVVDDGGRLRVNRVVHLRPGQHAPLDVKDLGGRLGDDGSVVDGALELDTAGAAGVERGGGHGRAADDLDGGGRAACRANVKRGGLHLATVVEHDTDGVRLGGGGGRKVGLEASGRVLLVTVLGQVLAALGEGLEAWLGTGLEPHADGVDIVIQARTGGGVGHRHGVLVRVFLAADGLGPREDALGLVALLNVVPGVRAGPGGGAGARELLLGARRDKVRVDVVLVEHGSVGGTDHLERVLHVAHDGLVQRLALVPRGANVDRRELELVAVEGRGVGATVRDNHGRRQGQALEVRGDRVRDAGRASGLHPRLKGLDDGESDGAGAGDSKLVIRNVGNAEANNGRSLLRDRRDEGHTIAVEGVLQQANRRREPGGVDVDISGGNAELGKVVGIALAGLEEHQLGA